MLYADPFEPPAIRCAGLQGMLFSILTAVQNAHPVWPISALFETVSFHKRLPPEIIQPCLVGIDNLDRVNVVYEWRRDDSW